MKISKLFTDADLAEIKDAVHSAESQISGEIVPVVVESCCNYQIAFYRAAVLAGGLTALIILIIDRFYSPFIFYDPLITIITTAAGSLIAILLLIFIPSLRLLFVSDRSISENLNKTATRYFVEEGVTDTRQRTGIMILLALFERRVIIKADKGIAAVVDQRVWEKLIDTIITHIKKGEMKLGLIKAIAECSELLKEKGFVITPGDKNELSDNLRIER